MGGAISLCACVAFAELGSMFPDSGGQYIYLREAYGDLVAFLYGWMLFSVANGGTIAALSVASAAYAGQVFPIVSQDHVVFALAGITISRAHLLGLALIAVLTCVERDCVARNHGACGSGGTVLTRCGSVAIPDDCDLLLQRGGDLHPLWRASVPRHGAGWRFLQAHGGDSSQVADSGVQPDWA